MSTILYVYAMTNDSGVAPCVMNNKLTIACCKSKMREMIGKNLSDDAKPKDDIWIMGLCGKGLTKFYNKEHKGERKIENDYIPIYLAKINKVVTMKEYFSKAEYQHRTDAKWYDVVDNDLVATTLNQHNEKNRETDKRGKYALISDNFVYWGSKFGTSGEEIRTEAPYIFKTDDNNLDYTGKPITGIDKHYRGYIKINVSDDFFEKLKSTEWFLKGDISEGGVNQTYFPEDDDNENTPEHTCRCGGKK